jgi:hypothetical protein
MTDSSSEDVHMAQELMEAKMALGQARNQMTHMLRMGNFHIEIVPNKDIDIEKFFTKTMNNLFDRFGNDALEVKVTGMDNIKPPSGGGMHG